MNSSCSHMPCCRSWTRMCRAGRSAGSGKAAQPFGVDRIAHRVVLQRRRSSFATSASVAPPASSSALHVVEGQARLRRGIGRQLAGGRVLAGDGRRADEVADPRAERNRRVVGEAGDVDGAGRAGHGGLSLAEGGSGVGAGFGFEEAHRHLGQELREAGGAGGHVQQHRLGGQRFVAGLDGARDLAVVLRATLAICALVWKSRTR